MSSTNNKHQEISSRDLLSEYSTQQSLDKSALAMTLVGMIMGILMIVVGSQNVPENSILILWGALTGTMSVVAYCAYQMSQTIVSWFDHDYDQDEPTIDSLWDQ